MKRNFFLCVEQNAITFIIRVSAMRTSISQRPKQFISITWSLGECLDKSNSTAIAVSQTKLSYWDKNPTFASLCAKLGIFDLGNLNLVNSQYLLSQMFFLLLEVIAIEVIQLYNIQLKLI